MAGRGGKYTILTQRPSKRKCIIISAIGLILLLAIIIIIVLAVKNDKKEDDANKKNTNQSYSIKVKRAAVAADAYLCSQIGKDILLKGGSAVDGAIASLFCLGVVNPQSCGIGGGGFMVFYNRTKKQFYVYDYREEAPAAATKDMFVNTSRASVVGGLAIGIPGQVKGLAEIHKEHGKLDWSELVEPAIELAEKGFIVSKPVAKTIDTVMPLASKVATGKSLIDLITNENGDPYQEGDLFKNPLLAETLRNIKANGSKDFYEGELAKKIAADVQNASGIITPADLKNYKMKRRVVLKLKMQRNYTLNTMPLPSGGPVVAMIQNIMTGYQLSGFDLSKLSDEVGFYQRLVESMKFSYGQRGFLGDPDFVPKANISKVLDLMTNPVVAEDIRKNKLTLDKTHKPSYYGGTFVNKEDHGTSHLSLLAENGDAVAATATINYGFGSLVRSLQTGIIYNNEMDDFSTPGLVNLYGYPPNEANYIQPGKRPLSSMSPTIVTDENGDVKMVVGASGGSRIISGTSQVLLKTLYLGMPLEESVNSYRLHHQGIPNYITINKDRKPSTKLLDALKKIGHVVQETPALSNVQAIYKADGYIYAMSDRRKYSKADGY